MQLTDGEDLYTTVLNAPIGICILDAATLVAEIVNPKFLEVAGKPYEAIHGQFYWDAFAEARSLFESALTGVVESGEAYYANEVALMLIRNGREENIYVTFFYAPVKDQAGNIRKVAVWVLENTKQVSQRQQAEAERAAFQRERDRLKSFFMQAPAGICILDGLELVYELVNPGYQQLLPGRKLLGRPIFEALPELIGTPVQDVLLNVYHSGEPYEIKETLIPLAEYQGGPTKDRYFSFNFQARRNEWDEIDGILAFVYEVTDMMKVQQDQLYMNEELAAANEELTATNEELAQVNEQLQAAQRLIEEGQTALRLAINAANFGTWFIHSATREFITDTRLKELFGYYPDEDLSIEQALAQITEEYRGFVAAKLENAIYNNGDYDVTYPVVGLHDNRLRWLRAIGNLKADPSGAFSAFTGVVMDITDQYVAAKKVERAEESLRMATEAAGLGTYSINVIDRVFYPSEKLKEFFGYGPDEDVPYEAAINQIHPDYRQTVADLVEAAITQGVKYDIEYPIIAHNDGRIRWVRGIGAVQQDEKCTNRYFTGVLHEITEQKEDEIRKNDFIGMVSHELKTPLTSLNAVIQVANLKLKNSDDKFLVGAMDKANQQVKRMSSMINGFLNISRLESGKIYIEKHTFNIDQLLGEMIAESQLTVTTHQFELENCGDTNVYADRDKISSVISNLLSNAVKYSPKGKLIKVECKRDEHNVTVSVTDEGIGLKQGDIDKIFDRYFRVESSHTQHIAGFGIGLYLSAEIINRHSGKIWVESRIGLGSTFYFSLPQL